MINKGVSECSLRHVRWFGKKIGVVTLCLSLMTAKPVNFPEGKQNFLSAKWVSFQILIYFGNMEAYNNVRPSTFYRLRPLAAAVRRLPNTRISMFVYITCGASALENVLFAFKQRVFSE